MVIQPGVCREAPKADHFEVLLVRVFLWSTTVTLRNKIKTPIISTLKKKKNTKDKLNFWGNSNSEFMYIKVIFKYSDQSKKMTVFYHCY